MNRKIWIVICLVLVAVLAGASVLYRSLGSQMQLGGLATQPAQETQSPVAPDTDTAPTTAGTVPPTSEAVDYSAPDFTVFDWDGNAVKLSDFEGKPVVLNFWASWCGPCKSEMPDFEEAYMQYGEQIHFLMVNCTGGRETVDSAKAFVEEQGYTFPVYFDTSYEASSTYGASSIPMTFFIDANGDLVTYGMGALSAEVLHKGIGMIYAPAAAE